MNARVGRAGTTPGPAYSFHNVPRCEPSISVVLTLAFTNQERDTAQSHYAGNAGDSVEGNTCIGSGGAFNLAGGLCRLGVMAARRIMPSAGYNNVLIGNSGLGNIPAVEGPATHRFGFQFRLFTVDPFSRPFTAGGSSFRMSSGSSFSFLSTNT